MFVGIDVSFSAYIPEDNLLKRGHSAWHLELGIFKFPLKYIFNLFLEANVLNFQVKLN